MNSASLSDYIHDDIRLKIETGVNLPLTLTLHGIANYYRTSIMPVRLAIIQLVEEGYLSRLSNGRLVVNESKFGTTTPELGIQIVPKPPTNWFKVISDEVYSCILQNQSTCLRIETTAKKFGISRSLVHNIYHRLAGSGLLRHQPRRGWLVRPFSIQDLNAFIQTRELMECHAVDQVRNLMDREHLQRLLARHTPSVDNNQDTFDNSMHRYWIELSGNNYFLDFFDRHGTYYEALLAYSDIDPGLHEEMNQQHRDVLTAMLNSEWRKAKNYLCHDIRRLWPILVKTMVRSRA